MKNQLSQRQNQQLQQYASSSSNFKGNKDAEPEPTSFEMHGAGTAAANGVYTKSSEMKNGKPVWKKEGSNAFIMWWNQDCGYELYSNGMKNCCSYWTRGGVGTSPVDSVWSVRGDQGPAPQVRMTN